MFRRVDRMSMNTHTHTLSLLTRKAAHVLRTVSCSGLVLYQLPHSLERISRRIAGFCLHAAAAGP